MKTYVKCKTCGRTELEIIATHEGWLVRRRINRPEGHLVIRCPDHITDYSLRLAGVSRDQFYRGGGPVDNGDGNS